ncbi:MAG TPA: hypothetical protein VF003_16300 [Pseudonocardiaceae bacterium]
MTRRPTDVHDQLDPAAAAASVGASPPIPAEAPPSKFTVLLDPDAAIIFDQLAVDIRRLLGRRVAKGDLVRALIALAAADLTLRDQLLNELRTRPPA